MERRDSQEKPDASVPEAARQASEVRGRWPWVEPGVWTDRMLSALEMGVKGGVLFSLIDKVYRRANLESAARKVIANKGAPGVDHVTVDQYGQHRQRYLDNLERSLRGPAWKPKAIRRHYIAKAGSSEKRPLGIPCVEDRVVQTALRNVIEPIFEHEFHENSYGFRPGRGCKDALRIVDEHLKRGDLYVVDADLRKFFDTIPPAILMERVAERVADSRVLALIALFLEQEVLDDMERWTPERGTPQGAVISPLLANIFLNPLDHLMAEHGHTMVRYADDSVILCHNERQAHEALMLMRQWCEANGLELHPDKTHIADLNNADEGFDFLGYRFQRTRRDALRHWVGQKACIKLRTRIRPITRRSNGHSMSAIIDQLNPILRGWFEYFKQSNRTQMKKMDGWIRMRLRSIKRQRRRKKGRGVGLDHFRWPNAHFAKLGLYSLEHAWAEARQSFRCNH